MNLTNSLSPEIQSAITELRILQLPSIRIRQAIAKQLAALEANNQPAIEAVRLLAEQKRSRLGEELSAALFETVTPRSFPEISDFDREVTTRAHEAGITKLADHGWTIIPSLRPHRGPSNSKI